MAYPVDQIINIVTRIRPGGLGVANFGMGMLFAPVTEAQNSAIAGTFDDFSSLAQVADAFETESESYKVAARWFGMTPKPTTLRVYYRDNTGDSILQSLTAAAEANVWWYWTLLTDELTELSASGIAAVAAWCDGNEKFLVNGTTDAGVINPATTTDVCSVLTDAGSRRVFTLRHSDDPYAAVSLAARFSRVNFAAANSTITGEFGKLPGVAAEDLSVTAYNAMRAKKAVFYTKVETGGQVDDGRVINSVTHSAFGEYIDDVVNLDAFVNALKVGVYNALANATSKVAQTPRGQQILIDAASQVGEQFILNGFLGEREYIHPETGEVAVSRGYEVLTKPEDIYSLSDSGRAARKAAPIIMRIFRAGAIHAVDIQVDTE